MSRFAILGTGPELTADDVLFKGCYVVLHIGVGPSHAREESGSALVVTDARKHFALTDDIWIERLDEELARNIQKACEPPHYNMSSDQWDKHLYAFVRRVPDVESSKYEGMADLLAVIALSRLIHPTSTGERYCANIFHFGLKDSAIQAIQYRGMSPDVFLGNAPRDWLPVEDGENLSKLTPWFSKDKHMHNRVLRAYWNYDYAMHSYYLDVRWIFVVSGLEALISVGENDNAWQFRDRVGQIAREFQIGLTDEELRLAYRLRSKLVHAKSFLFGLEPILPKSQHKDLYDKLESLLRTVVKRSLLDENFASLFHNDAAVEAQWPLSPKHKAGRRERQTRS